MSAVVDVAEAVGLSPGTLHVDLYGWVVEAGVANDRVQKIARSLLDGEQMPFLLFGKPASPVTTESEAAGGIGELKSAISGRQPILITLTHTSATFQYRNENGEAVSRKRNLVFNVLSEISDEEDRISGLSITPATFFGKGESAVWNDSEEELRLFFLAPIIRCKRPVDALPTESDLMRGNTQEKQQEKTEGELGDSGIEEEADIAKKEKPGSPAASGKSSPVRLTARMLHDLHTREVEKRKTMSRQQSGLSQLEQQKSPAEDGECESGQAKSFHQSHIATIRKSSLAESRFTEVNKQLGTALPEKDSDAHEDDSSGLAGIPSLSPLDARRASWTAQTRGSPPNGTGGTILEPRHCAKQITSTTIRQMFDEGFPIPKEADPVVYALSLFLCIQKGWPEGERFSGKAPRWTGTNFESFTYDVKDTRRSVEAFFYDQNVFQAGQATSVQGLARELQLHRRINHPGIRRLEGVWQHGNRLVIVFDLPKGGDLLDHLHKFGTYTEKEASKLVHLLLSTLNFLHDHGVIHRDLKPSNVFLTSDTHRSTVILGNLQSAAFDVPWPIPFKNKYGSPGYVAPEILREQAHDSKTDVFSVGVLLFIVLSGKPPFAPGKADNKGGSGPGSYQVWKEVLLNNARCNWSFEDEVWLKVSPAAKHLVTATLQFGVTRWRRRLSIGVGVSPPESPEGGETQLSAEGEVEDEAALEQTNREISTSWLSNLKLWSTQQANSSSSCSPPNTTRSPPAQAKNTKKKAPGSPAQWEGGGESEKGERDPSRSKPRGNRSLRAVSLHSNGEFKSKSEGRSPPVSPEAGGWHYQSVAEASPPSAGGGGELGLSTGTNSRPAMRRSDSRRRSSVAFSSLVAHEGGTVGYISDFAQQGSNRAYTLSAATRASPVTFSMASRPSSQAAGSAPRSPAGFGYVPTWRGEKKKDDKLTVSLDIPGQS
uniref:Protein kinase domain-containing protein n=1 Tax=Chromera velia CCMP2878 TaxID=1169474 RepID=A0A0G4F0H6_9ALVE|eukprot:Cvel_14477.t1-p1 / transcript=Cvel_14477.t1 / gene=Cvel_14477 / organism=Chromera_velia_CCMP2878 / gene_product=Calcium/calmodulin-dependent protein kinase type 1, putative / transcript_product=Calcium/calmodulin-dependent protein kinase type 1, putative / location=Cvel_scaffold1031:34151-40355(+) / protein_length=938 / sequence_SO=supercontig / SO=protein_coding / is_pseudo=false